MDFRQPSAQSVDASRDDIYCLQTSFYPICPLTLLIGRSEAAFFWEEVLQLHESDNANKSLIVKVSVVFRIYAQTTTHNKTVETEVLLVSNKTG
jgi:hypothetical protein